MFQQGKRIQNLNDNHQGTRLLLDNSLLQLQCQKLDTDGHIGILNLRVDHRRRDVAALEARLDNLEAASVLLTAKVAALEPCLCHCGREEQPIVVEDGERQESSPSSYQTLPVASLDENQVPLPVRIEVVREGQLVPVVEQEEIDELFQAINREADHNNQEELLVCSPNGQRRWVQVRHRAQILHAMSTAVDIQLGSHSEELMGLRGLFGTINPFKHVSTSTMSTTSMERRSVERNMESTAVMTPRLNLDWIASRTMTRLRQVSILFLVSSWQESVLLSGQHDLLK